MSEESADRWPIVVEAGAAFADRLRPIMSAGCPTLDVLFDALLTYYAEIPVEAFAPIEQSLMVEWGDWEAADMIILRRGLYDDGRCCDVFLTMKFARDPSVPIPDLGSKVCDLNDSVSEYAAQIRALPVFQRHALDTPIFLNLCVASASGDHHDFPEFDIPAQS